MFLILQNALGVFLVYLSGHNPLYGLFAGSVSLAGGHGTAIAWGDVASKAGLHQAQTLGIAMATFGLIAGGLLGGPIAEYFITRYKLSSSGINDTREKQELNKRDINYESVLTTILMLAICVEFGDIVNRFLFSKGVVVPGFLTAMLVGIMLTNIFDLFKRPLNAPLIGFAGEYSLQFFLSMSLMSMELWTIFNAIGGLFIIISLQSLLITLFAVIFVFRMLGKDYDASVISAGFVGLGLGATPVAVANMSSVTEKYGPSIKAFLVVPIVGAFFIDIMNALIIQKFLQWFG